ncbi:MULTISPECIES: hypothetical protein [Ferrimonas]|uniref:hypothetical protein n=1 Tax=Ferrimonas TaxID=44011 RepID=UPI0003FCC26A|nr:MULTISPECIES: hypothetical protein [Ferrimonas]USD39534.1 hypothetical protein J8Z22_10820 [Ferrimonas sp. SCSIO 43195]
MHQPMKWLKVLVVMGSVGWLSGCSEANQERVDRAMDNAQAAARVILDSTIEVAQVLWLEAQHLGEDSLQQSQAMTGEAQLALERWRPPQSPVDKYAEREVAMAKARPATPLTGEAEPDASQD